MDGEKLQSFITTDDRTGVDVLPAPQRPEQADLVGQTELAAVLDAARHAYDAVVIDTGPLFDAAVLTALDHSDQLLLVSNPEVTSLKNVRIGLETIDRLGFARERVSLVANRIGAAGAVDREDIELALNARIAFELPDDPHVPAAVNRALPVVVADESSPFSRAIAELLPSVFPARAPNEQARETVSNRRFRLRAGCRPTDPIGSFPCKSHDPSHLARTLAAYANRDCRRPPADAERAQGDARAGRRF